MKRRYKNRTGIGIIALVVLILCGIVSFRGFDLREKSVKAKHQIKKLESQIIEQEERATDIKNLTAYVQTKRYIEDMAREKLGLVYEDEIIFQATE